MTYTNIVYSMGIDNFAERVGKISGIILADLPLREIGPFEKGFKKHKINVIRFLTPESRDEDINRAVKSARDFIYFVSKRGTTGGAFALDEETREKIGRVKASGKEVFVGFGIKGQTGCQAGLRSSRRRYHRHEGGEELEAGVDQFRRYIAELR